MRLTWLGHATALIESDGVRVLTDPVLRDRVGHLIRIAPAVAPEEVDPVDGILVSHLHADHADIPTLRAVACSGPVVVPRPAGGWFAGRGVKRVAEVAEGEVIELGALSVRAVHAEHEGRRWPRGPDAPSLGFVIRGSSTIYFAGDTDLYPEMADLAGPIDVALLPVWGWGKSVGAGHLDPERAAEAVAIIRPRVAIPIHWGSLVLPRVLRGGTDPHQVPRDFARRVEERSPGSDVRILEPGGTLAL